MFQSAIIRMYGKRLKGGAGYSINRNGHMLQGYTRTSVDVADVPVNVPTFDPAVDEMARLINKSITSNDLVYYLESHKTKHGNPLH